MPIKELLSNIYIANQKNMGLIYNVAALSKAGDASWIEFYWATDKLNQLFSEYYKNNSSPTIESLKPFVEFLAAHWDLVKNDPQHSLHSTRPYLDLAEALAIVYPAHRYQLLMPTVNWTSSLITNTDYSDKSFQFEDFILGDNHEIIEIYPCLKFAEIDGVLKHTQLLPKDIIEGQPPKAKNLSETEITRLLNHCPEAKQYYSEIKNLITIKNENYSFGSFLTRLIKKLYIGSVAQKGSELVASAEANEAVLEFFRFVKTLKTCTLFFNSASNSYNLLLTDEKWKLIYSDPDNNKKEIPIDQVKIKEITWVEDPDFEPDSQGKKPYKTEIKEVQLKDFLTGQNQNSISAENKLKIADLIKTYHYNFPPLCPVEFVTQLPGINSIKPETYYLSLAEYTWKLFYVDREKQLKPIDINNVKIYNNIWDKDLAKYTRKFTSLLDQINIIERSLSFESEKPAIIDLISCYHHNKNPDDGSEKGILYSRFERRISHNIQHYFDFLSAPYGNNNAQGLNYCVKLISDALQNILDNNPDLFNIYPENLAITNTLPIEIAITQMAEAEKSLQTALKKRQYRSFQAYFRSSCCY